MLTQYPATPFDASNTRTTLFGALVNAVHKYGSGKVILEDHERRPITYGRLIVASLVLGRKLEALTSPGQRVGVLLPNSQALIPVLFGLNAFGRVPALLNFTAGQRNLDAACQAAGLKLIVTSRRFIEHGKLDDAVAAFTSAGYAVIYLEDVRDEITSFDKLRGLVGRFFARKIHEKSGVMPDDDAVILFTSGSEGLPKGVALTNANLLANVHQIDVHVRHCLLPDDAVFNPLPIFHSFGLTAGLLLWLFTGHRVVLYPSPLHFRQIPRLIAATNASILIATDTFSRHYVRAAEEGMLSKVRIIVAGAEQVRAETRRLWEPFNTLLLEGYGATECAPVIAVNPPHAIRPGTVGTFLPGIEARLEPVEGLTDGGRLHVRGPNVMRGYLDLAGADGVIAPPDGWHDTGDIVVVDDDGYVSIRGRAKRFAKLGGEMVSLAAVEALVQKLWPEDNHVVVALPDPRKGEQLVLVTSRQAVDKDDLMAFGKSEGFPELWIPRAVLVAEIPLLGTGKVDYGSALELAGRMRSML